MKYTCDICLEEKIADAYNPCWPFDPGKHIPDTLMFNHRILLECPVCMWARRREQDSKGEPWHPEASCSRCGAAVDNYRLPLKKHSPALIKESPGRFVCMSGCAAQSALAEPVILDKSVPPIWKPRKVDWL